MLFLSCTGQTIGTANRFDIVKNDNPRKDWAIESIGRTWKY